jgi:hypothetical protein
VKEVRDKVNIAAVIVSSNTCRRDIHLLPHVLVHNDAFLSNSGPDSRETADLGVPPGLTQWCFEDHACHNMKGKHAIN